MQKHIGRVTIHFRERSNSRLPSDHVILTRDLCLKRTKIAGDIFYAVNVSLKGSY